MEIMSIISAVVVALFVIGFLIGVLRGWLKSTVRFGLLVLSVVLAIVVVPLLSEMFVENCVDGTTISILGFSFDFADLASKISENSEFLTDILESSTTTNLVVALMNIIINIALYFGAFFAIWAFSLLIYGIVSICLTVKNRKKDDEKKKKKTAANRLIGGAVGFVSMVVICFAMMIPVFGAISICDEFLESDSSSTEQSASAASLGSYLCGSLYYTEDETIGKVETYIEQYAEIRSDYDSSFAGNFFNIFGLSKLGSLSFNYLTTVETNGMEVSLSDEVVAVIETYNLYKDIFVANTFEITNNDSLDGVMEIFDTACSSNIVESYILEFLPKFYKSWSSDSSFLGISCPVDDEYKTALLTILEVFSTTDNISVISSNVSAIVDTLKIANNHGLIAAIQDENTDVIEYISNEEDLIYDLVLSLTETDKLKNAIPEVFDQMVQIAYKTIVGTEGTFDENTLNADQISAIDWEDEATILQNLVTKILGVYNTLNSEDGDILNELTNLGTAIDLARQSAIASEPLKTFINGYINLDSVNIGSSSGTIKNKITGYIDSYWGDSTYSFENLFAVVQETATIANTLATSTETITLENLQSTLETILSDDNVKDTISDLISSDVVTELIPEDYADQAEVLTDMLSTFIENTTTASIASDIAAAQQIVNIISSSSSSDETSSILGDDETEQEETASTIVTTITSSDAIMSMIESAVNTSSEDEGTGDTTNSTIQTLVSNISDSDKNILASAITSEDNNISEDYQNTLLKLFGITLTEDEN